MIITFSISIIGLVYGSFDYLESNFGCKSSYPGLLEVYNKIDMYMAEVDSQLCSPSCPCKFNNVTGYVNNTNILPYYTLWSKEGNGSIQYQQCSDSVKNEVAKYYNQTSNNTDPIDQYTFGNFFNLIETTFECNGLCEVSYTPRGSLIKSEMYKYMFSDLSK